MAESVAETRDKPIGVVDALSAGYRTLTKHWYLALVPFLLDVFLWLGPQISPWAAVKALLRMADPEVQEVIKATMGLDALDLTNVPSGPNLLTALVQGPGSPGSLAASLGSLPVPPSWAPIQISPASPWSVFGLIILLLFLGTPVAGLYMTLAARAVLGSGSSGRPEKGLQSRQATPGHISHPARPLWKAWAWATVNLAALVLFGLVLFTVAVVGLSLMAALGMLLGQGLAVAVLGVGSLFMSWLMVMSLLFFYFTPASIVLQQAHALQALARSAIFVFRNLWSSMGLVLISMLISEGFALIWRRLFIGVPGVVASMAGNAYLTTGLTLGALIFFQDRFARMREVPPSSAPVA